MTNDRQLIDILRGAIGSASGPQGGEVRIAVERVLAELDKAGYVIKRKDAK
jgi:hypothetical protein